MADQMIVTSEAQANEIEQKTPDQITPSGVTSSGVLVTVSGTAPVAVREVAYVLKSPHFDDFPIYASANAWWMDSTKLDKLIDAFKQGHLIGTACFYAGISLRQWEYFNTVHPDFCGVKEQIETHPLYIKAMNSVAVGLDNDPKLAMSFLRARHPSFKRTEKVDAPVQQVVQQTVQVAVSQNVDTAKIEDDIARAADAIVISLRGSEGGGIVDDRQSVAPEGQGAGA